MNKKLLLTFGLLLTIIIVLLLSPGANELQPGEVVQQGDIEISDSLTYTHEILYPKSFSRPPRVEIKLITGSGYLEIVEQRSDGFVFKSSHLGYSVAEGAQVKWRAAGFVNNN